MKEHILQTQTSDWKQRQDAVNSMFDFISANTATITSKNNSKLAELADAICRVINDQNAKIQQTSLERFQQVLLQLLVFVENYIQTFIQALAQSLASTNAAIKKQTESIMQRIMENIDKTALV